jgi:hypothetical protein
MKRKPSGKVCRKLGYKSKPEARDALNAQKDIGVKRFYKCPYCKGLWHLTSESR